MLAGCGSGGGTNVSPVFIAVPSPTPSAYISQTSETTVSFDAKILAVRQAFSQERTGFVSLDAARAFDADLSNLRAAYPNLATVHARPEYGLTSINVRVAYDAPWLAKWRASAAAPSDTTETDLTTGEPAIDVLLAKYHATRTVGPLDIGQGSSFTLRFAQSLNTPFVAREFAAAASPNVASVSAIRPSGYRDDIVYVTDEYGQKIYTFSQGYGDCSVGCSLQYKTRVTIAPNGTVSVQTEGYPPPQITTI